MERWGRWKYRKPYKPLEWRVMAYRAEMKSIISDVPTWAQLKWWYSHLIHPIKTLPFHLMRPCENENEVGYDLQLTMIMFPGSSSLSFSSSISDIPSPVILPAMLPNSWLLSLNISDFFTVMPIAFFLLTLALFRSFIVENLNEVLYLLFLELVDGVTSSPSCIWTNKHPGEGLHRYTQSLALPSPPGWIWSNQRSACIIPSPHDSGAF
jgi:hypothetical protein